MSSRVLRMLLRAAFWLIGPVMAVVAHVWALTWRVPMHPDAVFQYLEPAHRHLSGTGMVAWEWTRGLRSWLLPALNGVLLQTFHAFSLSPRTTFFAVLGCWSLASIPVIAAVNASLIRGTACASGPRGRAWMWTGMWLVLGGSPLLLQFSPQVLSELASAYALLLAYAAASDSRWRFGRDVPTRLAWCLGGLSALALCTRISIAPAALVPFLVPLVARRWRALAQSIAMAAGVVLCFGALDWLTWGRPFHSTVQYFTFNVLEHGADRFGVLPATWYYETLGKAYPTWLLGVALAAHLWLARRTWFWTLGGVLILVSLSSQPHKEGRFVLAALWLLTVPVALAAGRLLARAMALRLRSSIPSALALGALLVAAWNTSFTRRTVLDSHDCGDWWGGMDAQLYAAGQPDVTGILFEDAWYCSSGYGFAGGVPLRVFADGIGQENTLFNYHIVSSKAKEAWAQRSGMQRVLQSGTFSVYRRLPQ